LYAIVMMLTVFMPLPKPVENNMLKFLGGVSLGSAFLWWITLPFAVAVNEDRWHPGGYLIFIFYLLWHCIITIGFAWLWKKAGQDIIFSLVLDLFFILVIVAINGCNASQSIIALAETIRPDERREIRQTIRAFQEFKYKILGVGLYNYVPMVAARPALYYFIMGISFLVVGLNTYIVIVSGTTVMSNWMVFLKCNITILVFITWLVLWYASAFYLIQKEVYKG
jgi:hypothetical protein